MPALNQVMLMGNLTRDPELRHVGSNQTAVCEFGMAINERYKKNDEWHEETLFVDVVAWGRQAEIMAEYCSKGRCVFVEGRLKLEKWEAEDGSPRQKLRVTANKIQFMSSKEEKEIIPESKGKKPSGKTKKESAPVDDDIPF